MRFIITENQELKLRLFRRLEDIDFSVPFKMREMLDFYDICKQSPEIFIDSVVGGIGDDLYYAYFSHVDDNSKEWKMIFDLMEKYIRVRFTDQMINFHSNQCNKS